jgi:hypothetical protein
MRKSIKIRIANQAHSEFIQSALFLLGCGWSSRDKVLKNTYAKFLYAYENGNITMGNDEADFSDHKNTEVFTDDLLTFPKKELVVTLNNTYSAVVDYKTRIVKVGCQEIPICKVIELADLIKTNEPDV